MSTFSTCTSSTRPGSPANGDVLFETDTKNVIIWDGTNWRGYVSDGVRYTGISNSLSAFFDGTDDSLSANDSSLNLQTDFSIACWFNRGSGVASWDALVSWGEASSGKYRAFGFNANNNLTFNAYAVGYNSSGQTLNNSTWYHGVLTVSGSGSNVVAKVYVNGSLDSTVDNFTLNTYSTYGGHLFGRSSYGGSEYYNGHIDELGIWNSVLTATDVGSIYNSYTTGNAVNLNNISANLVAWYRMGDSAGDTDSGGGTPGNTDVIGTVVNASTVSGSGGSGANITGSNATYSTTIS
jgi:hypothetical protein